MRDDEEVLNCNSTIKQGRQTDLKQILSREEGLSSLLYVWRRNEMGEERNRGGMTYLLLHLCSQGWSHRTRPLAANQMTHHQLLSLDFDSQKCVAGFTPARALPMVIMDGSTKKHSITSSISFHTCSLDLSKLISSYCSQISTHYLTHIKDIFHRIIPNLTKQNKITKKSLSLSLSLPISH